jgi:hypothetical protein
MKLEDRQPLLVGKKFNKLTLITFDHFKNIKGKRYDFWLCYCDCGNSKILSRHSIQYSQTKSCGCLCKNKIPKLGFGGAAFNKLFNSYKLNSKSNNREFKLTKSEFKDLTTKNCYYCDCIPSSVLKSKDNTGNYIYNGIDRVNNNKGYILDNCVSCCGNCNKSKLNRTQEEYLEWIKKSYINLFLKS